MPMTKPKLEKAAAAHLEARSKWNTKKNGPLSEPTPLAAMDLAIYLAHTDGGRCCTPTEIVADAVAIVLAAVNLSYGCSWEPEIKRLERALLPYGAVVTALKPSVEVLFCGGEVGHLCRVEPFQPDPVDLTSLLLAVHLARTYKGRFHLRRKIAEDVAALMHIGQRAKAGKRGVRPAALKICDDYHVGVVGPGEDEGVSLGVYGLKLGPPGAVFRVA